MSEKEADANNAKIDAERARSLHADVVPAAA